MAKQVTPMAVKFKAAVVAAGEGEKVNVAAVCRSAGISRKTFYKWVRRYREDGIGGLDDRSRRPHRTPHETRADVKHEVERLRKELESTCGDHGATTIQWHLGRNPA